MNKELDKLDVNNRAPAEPVVRLEMSVPEANTVFAALGELPHRIADPILRKLIGQAQASVQQG